MPFLEKCKALQHPQEFPARTVLLQAGKVAQNFYFVEKGCLRMSFDAHGKETTVQFFFEYEGVASQESFYRRTPSMFALETIEPVVVWSIPHNIYMYAINDLAENTAFLKALVDMAYERQHHYITEFLSRIRDTPEERYKNLLRERPHIVQRVPQHYIASYLGISPVHLSRIKNKLAGKNGVRSI